MKKNDEGEKYILVLVLLLNKNKSCVFKKIKYNRLKKKIKKIVRSTYIIFFLSIWLIMSNFKNK